MLELSSSARFSTLLVRVRGISCFPASLITSCLSSPGAASRTPPVKREGGREGEWREGEWREGEWGERVGVRVGVREGGGRK